MLRVSYDHIFIEKIKKLVLHGFKYIINSEKLLFAVNFEGYVEFDFECICRSNENIT